MAKTKISEFSPTPANNTDIDNINIAEGCAPSGINDAIRELMAQLKDFQAGTAGDSFNGPIGSTTAVTGAFTNVTASGTLGVTGVATLGNGAVLGTPASVTLTNGTGLPIATGVSGLGTGVATALAVNVGSAGAPVVNGGALGTPSSGTVTNLTGTASININGTVGATTATTGAFTTLAASGAVTLSGGTANGVAYLNGSKVLTTGSALTFSQSGGTFSTTFNINSLLGAANYKGGIVVTEDDAAFTLYGGSNYKLLETEGYSTPSALKFYASNSEQMRLTSTGLGIGTSSPSQKLHVVGNALVTPSGGWTTGGVATQYFGDVYGSIKYDYNTTNFLISSYGSFSIATNGTSPSTRLTLDSSGNLGLATTSVSTAAWGGSYPKLAIGTGTATGVLQFQATTAAANDKFLGAISALNLGSGVTANESTGVAFYQDGTSATNPGSKILFQTRADGGSFATRATLDNSGNLGLGVTPSAWGANNPAIQMGGGNQSSFIGLNATAFGLNAYFDGTNWRYLQTGGAAALYSQAYAGGHAWRTAPSGTAGDAISFTQAMTLDASGLLGIGTTSATSRLHVSGTANNVNSEIKVEAQTVASGYLGSNNIGFNIGTDTGSIVFKTGVTGGGSVGATGAERARIDSSGNLIQTVNTTAATLATNNTLTFSIVDNSTLRISVRGSDGTTRTATVALT